MYSKIISGLFISSIFLNIGCKKTQAETDQLTCMNIQKAKITATTPVKIGDEIKLNVAEVGENSMYNWNGPDNFRSMSASNSIGYAELKHEGWYYVSLSNNSCESKVDSIYIDVQLEQGTPSCNAAANTVGYSNLADDNFSYVSKRVESTYGLLSLEGSGNGNIYIYFHPGWRTKEPEDGIYTTTNVPLFDQVDNNYNKVFISTVKESIYWSSHGGQQVFVSHINGKLQVRFCSLNMGGYNGMSFTTSASGNVIEK